LASKAIYFYPYIKFRFLSSQIDVDISYVSTFLINPSLNLFFVRSIPFHSHHPSSCTYKRERYYLLFFFNKLILYTFFLFWSLQRSFVLWREYKCEICAAQVGSDWMKVIKAKHVYIDSNWLDSTILILNLRFECKFLIWKINFISHHRNNIQHSHHNHF
jgi:hypothetical protein